MYSYVFDRRHKKIYPCWHHYIHFFKERNKSNKNVWRLNGILQVYPDLDIAAGASISSSTLLLLRIFEPVTLSFDSISSWATLFSYSGACHCNLQWFLLVANIRLSLRHHHRPPHQYRMTSTGSDPHPHPQPRTSTVGQHRRALNIGLPFLMQVHTHLDIRTFNILHYLDRHKGHALLVGAPSPLPTVSRNTYDHALQIRKNRLLAKLAVLHSKNIPTLSNTWNWFILGNATLHAKSPVVAVYLDRNQT